MKRFFKIFSIILFAILCISIVSIAEEITLTTYYPAPYGAYEELMVVDGVVVGATYAVEPTETAPTSGMLIEGNVGIGTTTAAQALDVNGTVSATAMDIAGTVNATGYEAGGVAGASGTFITADIPPKTVTVVNGIITDITP
ncbi:MAG: hypothetical protein KKD11_04340, partial [Candidatus Omnitrophica bacterium]|nr:hypothetical protein [Candidatus Omnitrophota bacterium]